MQVSHGPTGMDGAVGGPHRVAFGDRPRTASPARQSDRAELIEPVAMGATGPGSVTPGAGGLPFVGRLRAGAERIEHRDLPRARRTAKAVGRQVAAQATGGGRRRGLVGDRIRPPDFANAEVGPRRWRPRAGPDHPPPPAAIASAVCRSRGWPIRGGSLLSRGMGHPTAAGVPAATSGPADTPRAGWSPGPAPRPWRWRGAARVRARTGLTRALRGRAAAGCERGDAPCRHPVSPIDHRGNGWADRGHGATARPEGGP